MIELKSVKKRLAGREIFSGICLKVNQGETVVLCGPSGTGKTTLLRAINGLESIDSGTISINGSALTGGKQAARSLKGSVGMLFQHYNLFEHLNATENICIALRHVLGMTKQEAKQCASGLLCELGMEDRAECYPAQLSGGERQRVALARCLAMKPSVMLLDEPTSALDPDRTTQVAELIQRLKDQKITTLIVTHDKEFAYRVADRMFSLRFGHLVDLNADLSCCDPVNEANADVPLAGLRAFGARMPAAIPMPL
ncbi:MAG: amino acid ABC transporter ATP-binding protein [Burkholderiales bacterium]|nr:amino acid ABC transporter ATP-binding protein [Burkholderiales bacterium]